MTGPEVGVCAGPCSRSAKARPRNSITAGIIAEGAGEPVQLRAMKPVRATWALFILTGVFVSLIVPLGEGFDEPWHFSYVQYVAQTGKLPAGPSMRLSAEVESFLLLHPIGWRLKDIFTNLQSQEEYWHSPNRLNT